MTILERVEVASIIEKIVGIRLRLFGHVERISVDSVKRRVDRMERNQITRGRGLPKNTIKRNLRDKWVEQEYDTW
jgi:hypothetical protein